MKPQKFPLVEQLPLTGRDTGDFLRLLHDFNPPFVWESSAEKRNSRFFSLHRAGRFAYIGFQPETTLWLEQNEWYVAPRTGNPQRHAIDSDPFDALRQAYFPSEPNLHLPQLAFSGGLVGFVSYDSARLFEEIKNATGHAEEPDIFAAVIDRLLVIDRELETLFLIAWHDGNEADQTAAAQWMQQLTTRLAQPVPAAAQQPLGTITAEQWQSQEEYVALVEQAKEYIVAGDIFQVVLSNAIRLHCAPDPYELYETLRHTNPSPYHYLFRFKERTFVGASPEVMLRGVRVGGHTTGIFMRPVAGTYPRAEDPEQDRQNAAALAASEKELAEHLMLVDLERNDIGRVSQRGSVRAVELFTVETYSHVHHLVSQVQGVLVPGADFFTALASCFPIGTLAGTPKIRAMEIIQELEGVPRGIFGGALFVWDFRGTFDSCVAIRGAVVDSTSMMIKTGAGIVFDSDPQREYQECLWKAQALFRALETMGGTIVV